MSFDLEDLRRAVAAHGTVVRVVIAATRGSTPRETGAAMLVWQGGQSGTIGGGALEFEAAKTAPGLETDRLSQHPLGPGLGQCCGGMVTLFFEIFDSAKVAELDENVIARPAGSTGPMPLGVRNLLKRARGEGTRPVPQLCDGWMIEPVRKPSRDLWIWGAGHVGRALVQVLAPLPEFEITWIDTDLSRYPEVRPDGVRILPATRPADLVRHAPLHAEHLILTYSHSLDLELCHNLLNHAFGFAGLIGSDTKWARFRSRLADLGHAPEKIATLTCPIGEPSLGKHPQAIALGVGTALLRHGEGALAGKLKGKRA